MTTFTLMPGETRTDPGGIAHILGRIPAKIEQNKTSMKRKQHTAQRLSRAEGTAGGTNTAVY